MRQSDSSIPGIFMADIMGPDGEIVASRLADALRITRLELANATGLSRDAVSKRSRLQARATQTRLREVAEILGRVLPWSGSLFHAYAWYRAQPLPPFGGQTPEDLVKAGKAESIRSYLSQIAVGGYA